MQIALIIYFTLSLILQISYWYRPLRNRFVEIEKESLESLAKWTPSKKIGSVLTIIVITILLIFTILI